MSHISNILVTGAAGYIGGSILADFLSRPDLIATAKLHAVVRSEEQAQALSKLSLNVLSFKLEDEAAVAAAVEQNKIDIVIHAANSSDDLLVTNLIQALGRRRTTSGKRVYFIHSSVTTLFSEEAGWPYGMLKDTDSIYEREKELGGSHPIRKANLLVVDKAQECGVTSFNVVVPNVYGRGKGEWRKVSILIPALIQASIRLGKVHKFDVDGHPPATHISDLVALYGILVDKILQNEDIPSGKNGYYFAMAHRAPWWAYMQAIAKSLHARGLVADAELEIWPSDEAAAKALQFPAQFIRAMGTASGGLEPVNPRRLGWQPVWNEKAFLESADGEVEDVLELDTIRTGIFDKVMRPATD
ncbi:NAD(P)-binding protein [Karstenula rhodostoma CBS 690.94]|uniref:NAD(P)-binding protein n=1 Tax=Karstenula rhodostoma CBS 690.94 TaxID=1392251 RepID=A0A9P4UE96_9PLEO|nr:NAD(P)-binding protein [Karstenula rhodostoma CBS 690.94]